MRTQQVECMRCAKKFTVKIRRGRQFKLCSPECKAARCKERLQNRLSELRKLKCEISGCERHQRRQGICEAHYYRKIRTGTYDRKTIEGRHGKGRYKSREYFLVIRPGHPLAMKSGSVYEHRVVAYEKHDGICPPCTWCGTGLTWKDAKIDHRNEEKGDNSPGNLLVACNSCNRARGAILPFLDRLTPDSFALFIKTARQYRRRGRA